MQIEANILISAIKRVLPAVARTSPKPILRCVLIRPENGLTLGATNLELSIQHTVTPDAVIPGEFDPVLVDAHKLLQVVQCMTGVVSMSSTVKELTVRSDVAKFTIEAWPVAEMPPILPTVEHERPVPVSNGDLDALAQLKSFAAKENSRYSINGVLIACKDGTLDIAATDGRSLGLYSRKCGDADCRVIVPISAIAPIRDALPSRVVFGSSHLVAFGADTVVATCVVDGSFPPFRDVIPKIEADIELELPALRDAISAAAVMTNDERPGIRFDGHQITSQAPEIGQSDIRIPVAFPHQTGVNPALMLNALSLFGDVCRFGQQAGTKPLLFTHQDEHATRTAVLMPMSLN